MALIYLFICRHDLCQKILESNSIKVRNSKGELRGRERKREKETWVTVWTWWGLEKCLWTRHELRHCCDSGGETKCVYILNQIQMEMGFFLAPSVLLATLSSFNSSHLTASQAATWKNVFFFFFFFVHSTSVASRSLPLYFSLHVLFLCPRIGRHRETFTLLCFWRRKVNPSLPEILLWVFFAYLCLKVVIKSQKDILKFRATGKRKQMIDTCREMLFKLASVFWSQRWDWRTSVLFTDILFA